MPFRVSFDPQDLPSTLSLTSCRAHSVRGRTEGKDEPGPPLIGEGAFYGGELEGAGSHPPEAGKTRHNLEIGFRQRSVSGHFHEKALTAD